MFSVTVLTKNCAKTLRKTLESLSAFPEVIVLDSGSTDETLDIAKQFSNVHIHSSPFLGFGPMHNYASRLASHDWIFSVDADEEVSKELAQEIQNLSLNGEHVYSVERKNFYNGKQIKCCSGWYPDFVIRLYHRKKTSFSDDLIHERILTHGFKKNRLASPLLHRPYHEIGDFLHKMQHYTTLFAEQNAREESSVIHAILHSWFAFIKSYIFKRGFLGGKEGFIISMYNGHTAFYKYLKLAERKEK